MSAASAVLAGRAAAEALMLDTCTVTHTVDGGFNESTGKYDPPTVTTLYSGKCQVQVPNVAESVQDSGDRAWTVQDALVKLPVVGSESIAVGHKVHIDSCALDADLVGTVYTVTAMHHKTFATARRLRCKEVS